MSVGLKIFKSNMKLLFFVKKLWFFGKIFQRVYDYPKKLKNSKLKVQLTAQFSACASGGKQLLHPSTQENPFQVTNPNAMTA